MSGRSTAESIENLWGLSESGAEEVESAGRSEGLSECVEWSPVVGMKDPPGFDVGDCPFHDGAETVDPFVAVLVPGRQLPTRGFLPRRHQAGSHISLVTNSAVVTDIVGPLGLGVGMDVVPGPGIRVRDRPHLTVQVTGELDNVAGGVVLAGVQLGVTLV